MRDKSISINKILGEEKKMKNKSRTKEEILLDIDEGRKYNEILKQMQNNVKVN
jgi:hypothetical protein